MVNHSHNSSAVVDHFFLRAFDHFVGLAFKVLKVFNLVQSLGQHKRFCLVQMFFYCF